MWTRMWHLCINLNGYVRGWLSVLSIPDAYLHAFLQRHSSHRFEFICMRIFVCIHNLTHAQSDAWVLVTLIPLEQCALEWWQRRRHQLARLLHRKVGSVRVGAVGRTCIWLLAQRRHVFMHSVLLSCRGARSAANQGTFN
jgi:hypothetical protein